MNKETHVASGFEPKINGIDKHIEFHEAAIRISSVVDALDILITRIEGPKPQAGCDKAQETEHPTLSEVLNGLPGKIRSEIDSAHKRISEINDLLF
ncbi:MAG: hypothetical protein KZQ94_16050 [Candidatus Thiodiazotropha sp. (ex Troendleina suluensis)]|nr:hypothetical protein [Candidatus Thiodiazotropha sp. (ex Troendleina suluensis)]